MRGAILKPGQTVYVKNDHYTDLFKAYAADFAEACPQFRGKALFVKGEEYPAKGGSFIRGDVSAQNAWLQLLGRENIRQLPDASPIKKMFKSNSSAAPTVCASHAGTYEIWLFGRKYHIAITIENPDNQSLSLLTHEQIKGQVDRQFAEWTKIDKKLNDRMQDYDHEDDVDDITKWVEKDIAQAENRKGAAVRADQPRAKAHEDRLSNLRAEMEPLCIEAAELRAKAVELLASEEDVEELRERVLNLAKVASQARKGMELFSDLFSGLKTLIYEYKETRPFIIKEFDGKILGCLEYLGKRYKDIAGIEAAILAEACYIDKKANELEDPEIRTQVLGHIAKADALDAEVVELRRQADMIRQPQYHAMLIQLREEKAGLQAQLKRIAVDEKGVGAVEDMDAARALKQRLSSVVKDIQALELLKLNKEERDIDDVVYREWAPQKERPREKLLNDWRSDLDVAREHLVAVTDRNKRVEWMDDLCNYITSSAEALANSYFDPETAYALLPPPLPARPSAAGETRDPSPQANM